MCRGQDNRAIDSPIQVLISTLGVGGQINTPAVMLGLDARCFHYGFAWEVESKKFFGHRFQLGSLTQVGGRWQVFIFTNVLVHCLNSRIV